MRPPLWRRYLRFWRSDPRADLNDELRFHLDERIDDLIARGRTREAAEREALTRFGDIELLKDTCEEIAHDKEKSMRRSEHFVTLVQDVGYAFRLLRKYPTVSAAIVLTLALGIGATTSVFSVVHAVILRPLPYEDAERVVAINETVNNGFGRVGMGHFTAYTESGALEAITAWQGRSVNLTDSDPTRILGARVTPGWFEVFKVPPHLGRFFRPDESEASRVVVITQQLWESRFKGDSSIIGTEITLSGERHTVIGIAPSGFSLRPTTDERLWTARQFSPEERLNLGAHGLIVFGKLKAGGSIAEAQRALERVTEDLRKRDPLNMSGRGVAIREFDSINLGNFRRQLFVLLGAVAAVLLIGCGNVASLLLARNAARRKEMAIRGALGGERSRLVRQLFTESAVLALVGGVLGIAVAYAGTRFLVTAGPPGLPRLAEAGLNGTVLTFALAVTAISAILFGIAPAVRATRVSLDAELREGGRGSRGVVSDRLRSALIVSEFAVSLVLLVSAGLLLRSGYRLQQIELGYDPEGVTMMRVTLPPDRYDSATTVQNAFATLVNRVRATPGFEGAAASTRVPMWGPSVDIGTQFDGNPPDPKNPNAGHVRIVTPGFTELMGIPLKMGRTIQESDLAAGAPNVVVVSERFARNVFPNISPIGHRISGWAPRDNPLWREVVGVVGDVRGFGQDNDVQPEIYFPLTQAPDGAWPALQRTMTVVAKAPSGTAVGPGMRGALRALDPLLPGYDLQAMDAVLSQATATRRFNMTLLTILGLTGLVLAAIGISGVISFFVSQRTQEFGIRVALGATVGNVMRLVVQQALILATLGVTIGGALAYWMTRSLQTMLFQVQPRDPLAFGLGAGLLVVVALIAASVPARRAAKLDPTRALSSG